MDKFKGWTDPEFIMAMSEKFLAVPVLFFVLVVMVIFYLVIKMLVGVLDKRLNNDKKC